MAFNLRAEEGSLDIIWREVSGCYESNPALKTSGYDIRLVHIPPKKSYQLAAERNIVAAVHGELLEPKLKAVDSSIYRGGSLKAGESDAVLVVAALYGKPAEDFTEPPALEGMGLKWVAAGKRWKALEGRNMHFTYPVIVIDNPELEKLIRVNLVEVVPQVPGQSHKPFWSGDGKYPWHQYKAGASGTLFGVVEKVPRK